MSDVIDRPLLEQEATAKCAGRRKANERAMERLAEQLAARQRTDGTAVSDELNARRSAA